MALDFKEAVGEDDAAKEEFCEVQKNQVPKLAFNKTNLISEPEAGFLKTYRDDSAKPPKLPNVPVAQMSQSPNIAVGFFENLLPGATFYSTQLKGED